MSNFSIYQNGETNRRTLVPIELRSTSMNDYYKQMKPESRAHAHVKREIKVEDDNYLGRMQTWIPNQIEENDVHCFVPTKEGNIDPNDIKTIYKCCNIKFYDKFLHFRHMIDHMEEQLMRTRCYYCNLIFDTEDEVIRHEKSAHIGFECMYCSQNFQKKTFLFKHLVFFHGFNYPKKKENLCRPKRCQLGRIFKRGKEIYPSKNKWVSSDDKMKPKCNVKTEPIDSNYETELANVKMALTDAVVKIEPTDAVVKMEPSYSNNEMERTLSTMKREPID